MTRIIVNDTLLGQLDAGRAEAEVCDASGKRVGYFLPDHVYRQLACRWANAQVTNDELETCRRESESFTTAEIPERLNSL